VADQALEADIVDGVEDAADHPERPVHTHLEYGRPDDLPPIDGSDELEGQVDGEPGTTQPRNCMSKICPIPKIDRTTVQNCKCSNRTWTVVAPR
jgi:hypothetical protein